jgi:squalene-hopene/tetraprenyl-beta-curcumene cyclase
MSRSAGGLDAGRLAEAIGSRYGNDRTFSVPILTVLAVAGLVPWRTVPQLPFELAALPRSWYARIGLPVVSYALPALIAIGHVRHRSCQSTNWLAACARTLSSGRTLDVLQRIQPSSGGFLEAVPLTSFVAISLRASGYGEHQVLHQALQFLTASVRDDGSWPIDTNLSTWVTTLSVNALRDRLPVEERGPICEWLLKQQYQVEHPYTGAAAGGWAWTDLPGGVPDADDTAGAIVALHRLGAKDDRVIRAAELGMRWLLGLQNRDGGTPTFCRGWGKLPFDRSTPDLTAHALQAWSAWRPSLGGALRDRVDRGIHRAMMFLKRTQRHDGAWLPLWFGNQFSPGEHNPVYGTSRVLSALHAVQAESPITVRGAEWLLSVQNGDGGWGADRGITSSIEETSVAMAALCGVTGDRVHASISQGAAWLVHATQEGKVTPPAPIGLYFAKLWYFERLYPLIFAAEAMGRASAFLSPV